MNRSDKLLLGLTGVVVLTILAGLFFLRPKSMLPNSDSLSENKTFINLGLVYLPVNSQVAAYYELTVGNGAMVTEITGDSPGSDAGIKVGDVIVSFNGTSLDNKTSLLGLIRECPYGKPINLGVQRGCNFQNIEIKY
jgi:membrane-associated protease RseP (regulator of RpoE activity)